MSEEEVDIWFESLCAPITDNPFADDGPFIDLDEDVGLDADGGGQCYEDWESEKVGELLDKLRKDAPFIFWIEEMCSMTTEFEGLSDYTIAFRNSLIENNHHPKPDWEDSEELEGLEEEARLIEDSWDTQYPEEWFNHDVFTLPPEPPTTRKMVPITVLKQHITYQKAA